MSTPRPDWTALTDEAADEMLAEWGRMAGDLRRLADDYARARRGGPGDPALDRRLALNAAERLYGTMLRDRIAMDPRPDDELADRIAELDRIARPAAAPARPAFQAGYAPTPVMAGMGAATGRGR